MSNNLYPSHNVDPNEKQGKNWLLQYARAVESESKAGNIHIFHRAADKSAERKLYAMGKQSIDKYKPFMGIEEGENKSLYAVDWTVQSLIPKFRSLALSKLEQREFHISATPIDPLAKDLLDNYFAQAKTTIVMREMAQKVGDPDIAGSPVLNTEPGQPEDLDELAVEQEFGAKLKVAEEAEDGIELIFYQNDMTMARRQVLEDLYDDGVGGYKDYTDENGMTRCRRVDPNRVITSFCRNKDFSDLVHAAEMIEVPMVELAGVLTEEERKQVAEKLFNNSAWASESLRYNKGFDGLKATVMDLELLSDDEIVTELGTDKAGNTAISRAKWTKKYSKYADINGAEEPRYFVKRRTNVYKIKWIVGTDICYDYGLATNMKREPIRKLMGKTSLNYHFYAYNFDNMMVQSVLERLIPLEDEYYTTRMKLQNLKARITPSGWAIDLDGLEAVSLVKGGKKMSPKAVLKMYFQTGVLLYRKSNLQGDPNNSKIIDAMASAFGEELVGLANELERIKQAMRDVTGLNEITDGSTPKERTLVQVGEMAQESTNNALYPLVAADKNLLERLAKGVILRLQQQVKNGPVEGVTMALGADTVKFLKATDAIAPHVWGIKIQDLPTDEERGMLLQQMGIKDSQGLIDPADLAMLYELRNIRKARRYLAIKIKKKLKQQQQDKLNEQLMLQKNQTESNIAAEKEKQETLKLQYRLERDTKLALIQAEHEAKMAEIKLTKGMEQDTQLVKQGMVNGMTQSPAGDEYPEEPIGEEEPEPQEDAPEMQPEQPSMTE
jgi:hypothetical protein